MKIGGFQRISLIDYPGKLSAVVFTRGCNFRCPFCHNSELVLPDRFSPLIPEDEIFSFLNKRTKHLDGVVITGGEPAMQADLGSFIENVKALGFLVKLDTNGSYPNVIKELLDKKLLDFVAMDIKSTFEKYSEAAGTDVNTDLVKQSIEIIKGAGVEHMFRTTLVKDLIEFDDAKTIKAYLKDSPYILQYFHPSEKIINPDLVEKSHYTQTEVAHFQEELNSGS